MTGMRILELDWKLTDKQCVNNYNGYCEIMDAPFMTPSYDFTEKLIEGGFRSFKDIDIALQEIAEYTGYDYNYLCEVFDDFDDEAYIDRIIQISDCAIEQDL